MRRFWIDIRKEANGVKIEVGKGVEVTGFMKRSFDSIGNKSWPPTHVAFAAWDSKVEYKVCLNQSGKIPTLFIRWVSSKLNSFFSGMETEFTFPAEAGAAKDGLEYYEVESEDTEIEGCYKKINFHSVHPKASGHKYPIYKQTGGQKNVYLRIDVTRDYAPWLFTDKEGNIMYR